MKFTMTFTTHNAVGISTYSEAVFAFRLRSKQGMY